MLICTLKSPFLLKYFQVSIQSGVDISGKQPFHSGEVVLNVVGVEGIVISNPVAEFDVNRRIAGLHQLKVHKQSAGSPVTIDKGMYAFKLDMETREFRHNMFFTCGVALQELFHFRLDKIRLHRFVEGQGSGSVL